MQQDESPASDYNSKDQPAIKPVIEVTQRNIKINQKDKPSLISTYRQVWPDTPEGALASLIAAADNDSPSDRDRVFELFGIYERQTTAIIEYEQYVYADAGEGTMTDRAKHFAQQTAKVRRSVAHFEQYSDDAGDLSRFYDAMRASLELMGDWELVMFQRYERDIIRGSDASYDGKGGVSKELQRDVVRKVRGSMTADASLGKNEAIRQAMSEFNVTRSQVLRFLDKF